MKMNKKKLAVISLVLCLVAIVSMTSLAWFTADDSIENTLKFTDPATELIVDVYEHDDQGEEVGVDNTTGLTYEDLMPGQVIEKDPTVRNKGTSESQWIRAKVSVSNATAWSAVTEDISELFTDINTEEWAESTNGWLLDEENDAYYCYYYLQAALEPYDATDDAPASTLFESVTIPGTVDNDNVEDLADTKIIIEVDAVQVTGLEDKTCEEVFASVKPEVVPEAATE